MEAPLTNEKLHRFVRRPLDRPFYPTERDEAVLLELFDGMRHTAQLQTLFGRWIDERLTLLYKAGLVDRPEAQWVWRRQKGGGSKPLVYALSNLGYRHLRDRRLVPAVRRDFSERNQDLSAFSSFIAHELGVGDAQVAFKRACAFRSLELRHAFTLARGQDARALSVPGRERPLYPDWSFTIKAQGRGANLFFVEVDRCTEPNVRYGFNDLQSLSRKYEGYLAYARAKRHTEQFGVSNFRVLTITTGGDEKVANVAQTAGEVCDGVGVGRFLVTNFAALAQSDPFEVSWLDASGNEVRLEI
jgi:hypothetical protein